jgi:putative tricarboxylic transport membrane protein
MSKIWAERLTALGMIAFAAVVLVQAYDMPFTSGDFPKFTSFVIILLAVIMIVRSFLSHDKKFEGDVTFDFSYTGMKPVYAMIVAAGYAAAVFYLGFYASSLIFFFVLTWMTGIRNIKVMALTAVVLFPLMYFFFTIALEADLPEGILI